jgi:transposase InsO family protein
MKEICFMCPSLLLINAGQVSANWQYDPVYGGTHPVCHLAIPTGKYHLHRRWWLTPPPWPSIKAPVVIVPSDQHLCLSGYRQLRINNGLIGSMSRQDKCLDNTVAESFSGTLKTEWGGQPRPTDKSGSETKPV